MNNYWLFVFAIYLGGTEAQSCKFPCYWRGKTFRIYQNGQTSGGIWTFTSDGNFSLQGTSTLECFKIIGEFIIFRNADNGNSFCVLTDIFDENTFTVVEGRKTPSSNVDTCELCYVMYRSQLTVVGVDPPEAPFPNCNKPSMCSGGGACPADRSLDIGTCDAQSTTTITTSPAATTTTTPAATTTTTPAATTTTTPAATSMRNCRRRHHSRGYIRKHHRGRYYRKY